MSKKNTNPWCRMMYRDWLESERIMEMSLAAEGLYHRCLMIQATRGSIPADLRKLARLLQKDYEDVEQVWSEVAPHFEQETAADGEERLYNIKQRELIQGVDAEKGNYSEGSRKGWKSRREKSDSESERNPKTNPIESHNNPKQNQSESQHNPKTNRALRASVSASVSESDSVSESGSKKKDARDSDDVREIAVPGRQTGKLRNARAAQAFEERFWPMWPNKRGKKDALKAWLQLLPDPELIDQMLTAIERQKNTDQWRRGIIPHASTWLRGERWNDEFGDDDRPAPPGPQPGPEPDDPLPPLDTFPQDKWADVLHRAAIEDREICETWLKPLHPLGTADGGVVLTAPSDFHARFVRSNYRLQLEELLGMSVRIIAGIRSDVSHGS